MPHPSEVSGLLTEEEAEQAKEAVRQLRKQDRSRFEAAGEAFESDTDEDET